MKKWYNCVWIFRDISLSHWCYKKVIESLKKQIDDLGINVELYGICTTGSARNLIGSILGANVIKMK